MPSGPTTPGDVKNIIIAIKNNAIKLAVNTTLSINALYHAKKHIP